MSTWNNWTVGWEQVILGNFSGANKITLKLLFLKKVCLPQDMFVWALINFRYPRRMMTIRQLAFHYTPCNIWLTPIRNAFLTIYKISNNPLLQILTWKKSKNSSKRFTRRMRSSMRKRSHPTNNRPRILVSSRNKQQNLRPTLCWRTSSQNRQMTPQ